MKQLNISQKAIDSAKKSVQERATKAVAVVSTLYTYVHNMYTYTPYCGHHWAKKMCPD